MPRKIVQTKTTTVAATEPVCDLATGTCDAAKAAPKKKNVTPPKVKASKTEEKSSASAPKAKAKATIEVTVTEWEWAVAAVQDGISIILKP